VKVPDSEISIFTPEDFARIIHAAPDRLIPLLAISAFAGIRSAEIARLDWSAVGREVVAAAIRVRSAAQQVRMSTEAVAAAEEMMTLARQRTASGVGVVLEYLLAREEFTRARRAQIQSITGCNAAQHALLRAVGR
jgi:integrase